MSSAGKGEIENFVVMVRKRRALMPTICTVGLGENKGIHLHVRRPALFFLVFWM